MFSLGEMARILGAELEDSLPESVLHEVPAKLVTDSRQAGAASFFVCIKGERVDGHDFIAQVAGQGAMAALASRDLGEQPPLPIIYTDDSVRGLGRLASAWREAFKGRVIGITGSAGKTSVKEVLAAILAVRGTTSKNFMNLNSQIGLPTSILNANADAAHWVMEAGISEPHDMDELGAMLRPDLAVVLNVGAAHLSGLEDRGVAYYKTRLLTHLAPGGRALVSADYPDLVSESRKLSAEKGLEIKYFSTRNSDAHYYATYLGPAINPHSGQSAVASGRYRVYAKGLTGLEEFEVVAPFRGAYGSENVAAICGAALEVGLSAGELILGFAGASLPAQRFACHTRGAFTLIDDSYNANPLSTVRMLETAREMALDIEAPLFLAMGEMLELGSEAEKAHHELGGQMALSGAALIIWKGGQARAVQAGLEAGGFSGIFRQAESQADFVAALPLLEELAGQGKGVILFKASRRMRLEEWAEAFKNNYFSKLEE